jgi:FkbM family methyltransferase
MKYFLAKTKYGPMGYLPNDIYFVDSLSRGLIFEQDLVEDILAPYVKKASVILDIGAHAGSHSLIYSALNPNCQIYSFEPQIAVRECLKFNIAAQKRTNITVMDCALGNKECKAQMHISVSDGVNCNVPIHDGAYFNLGGRQLGVGGDDVQIRRLDDIWTADMPPVDYIKIDVEGFEDFVVDGARSLFDRCKPTVFFEHNDKRPTPAMNGYYDPPAQSIMDFFTSRGYTITPYEKGNFLAVHLSSITDASAAMFKE